MGEIPWDTVLRGDTGSGQSWQLFKDIFLRAQELSVPICGKSGREGRKQAWLNEDLLLKLRQKELHRWWKQGRVPWGECRNAVRVGRDGVRKAKARMELNVVREAKNNKKGSAGTLSAKERPRRACCL